ncbi:MAG: sulfurtransferase TusA family protein [Candidatus Hodarchaeota archaeon]
MNEVKPDFIVDIKGLKCPVPLIETRRALRKASIGNIIEFTGTKEEEISRKEILVALGNLKHTVISDNYNSNGERWQIYVKKEN